MSDLTRLIERELVPADERRRRYARMAVAELLWGFERRTAGRLAFVQWLCEPRRLSDRWDGEPCGDGRQYGSPARKGAVQMVVQQTEGEGKEHTHTHPAVTHGHDHYHVSHHHGGGLLTQWEHRTYWHTHEHNHNALTHSHDYSRQDEEQHHAKRAHVHDHAMPMVSPA
jgi:hypothetical protein